MSNPLEHVFNNIVPIPPEVEVPNRGALLAVQQNMRTITGNKELTIKIPPELEAHFHGQEQLRGVLMTTLRESLNNSPTTTEPLHPGYPFREHTDKDHDLPQKDYPRPYLAAEVNPTIGDP